MAEKHISYLSRTYEDYKKELLNVTEKYYKDIFPYLNDASVGTWFIELFSDIADNLSYHIDRTYQETSIDSANNRSSLLNIARTQGVKIPGPKAALVEVELSCDLPLNQQNGTIDQSSADEFYAPYIKKGTLFSTGSQTFELINDCDFSNQFNEDGQSDRQIYPLKDSNGNIAKYRYKKLGIARAGQSKIYKKIVNKTDIVPFMSITINDDNIMGVESILVKQGSDLINSPSVTEFYIDKEEFPDINDNEQIVERYFEVDNLIEQYRFGMMYEESEQEPDNTTNNYINPIYDNITANGQLPDGSPFTVTTARVTKGKWIRLKNKFITEFTEDGSLKITFGAGIRNKYGDIPSSDDASEFTRYMMSRMEANDYMGVLPNEDSTIYVLYRTGGGESSQIAKDTLTYITYLNMSINGNCDDKQNTQKKYAVQNSLTVRNTSESYGGKDAPSDTELKYLIKYYTGAQNRCVTLKDYEARIMELPPKYGTPFRCCAMEENNKVKIYTLDLDADGNLSSPLSETVADNIKEYLSKYKMINDVVEIHSGFIINIGFEIDLFIDKNYDKSTIAKNVIEKTIDYMDIRKHVMGEDIFLGDLEKEISKIDGVTNMIELRCYNKVGEGYSSTPISQQLVSQYECQDDAVEGYTENSQNQIDLKASDKVLYAEANSMFELKNETDVKVNIKVR